MVIIYDPRTQYNVPVRVLKSMTLFVPYPKDLYSLFSFVCCVIFQFLLHSQLIPLYCHLFSLQHMSVNSRHLLLLI